MIVLDCWSLIFAFDCDCIYISGYFSLSKEENILMDLTVKSLFIVKRVWILKDKQPLIPQLELKKNLYMIFFLRKRKCETQFSPCYLFVAPAASCHN